MRNFQHPIHLHLKVEPHHFHHFQNSNIRVMMMLSLKNYLEIHMSVMIILESDMEMLYGGIQSLNSVIFWSFQLLFESEYEKK